MYTGVHWSPRQTLYLWGIWATGCRVQYFILGEIKWVTTDTDKTRLSWTLTNLCGFTAWEMLLTTEDWGKLQTPRSVSPMHWNLLMSVSPTTNTSLPMVARQFIDAISAVIVSCWLSSPEIPQLQTPNGGSWVGSKVTLRSAGRWKRCQVRSICCSCCWALSYWKCLSFSDRGRSSPWWPHCWLRHSLKKDEAV